MMLGEHEPCLTTVKENNHQYHVKSTVKKQRFFFTIRIEFNGEPKSLLYSHLK